MKLFGQKGYIEIFIFLAALLVVIIMLPATYSPVNEKEITDCEDNPKPIVEKFPPYNYSDQGFDGSKEVEYKLIRKNIYLSKNFFDPDYSTAKGALPAKGIPFSIRKLTDGKEYKVFYPDKITGVSNSLYTPSWKMSDFLFMTHGMIVVTPLTPEKGLVIIDGIQQDGEKLPMVKVSIYQDLSNTKKLDSYWLSCNPTEHLPIFYKIPQPSGFVYFPDQKRSADQEQLQLEWFLLKKGGIKFGWQVHCKPAIYLYPKVTSLINVQVFPKGDLTYTDPKYEMGKGWTVLAQPTGSLSSFNGQEYGYLYYEARIKDEVIKKPTTGFVVKFEELQNFYEKLLPMLGFNVKEKNDFVEYWQKHLDYSPYYFIGIMDKGELDQIEPLSINPTPETTIRVSLYFEALKEYQRVDAPVIKTVERKGYTLFEWGGLVKRFNETKYTCFE